MRRPCRRRIWTLRRTMCACCRDCTGLLRPLDLLQPYRRLEMGTRLANPRGKDLYAFWGERITQALNAQLKKRAAGSAGSRELRVGRIFQVGQAEAAGRAGHYAGVRRLEGRPLQDHQFSCEARARLMARYAVENRVDKPEQLKAFDSEGYAFDAKAVERFHLRISPPRR